MSKNILVLSFLIILSACQSEPKVEIDNSAITFFDLEAFFEKEIKDFPYQKIKKTVTLNGKAQTKELTDFDMKKELAIFINSNINKSSWKDKYKVVETANQITYEATVEKLKIRKIIIDKDRGEVIKIRISTNASQRIFTAEKELIYEPSKGYSIKNHQDVVASGETNMEIVVKFLK